MWDLGEPLTGRDATARSFEGVFNRDEPRDPHTWAQFPAQPVPEWTVDPDVVGRCVSSLGKGVIPGLVAHAREMGIQLPPEFDDLNSDPPPAELFQLLRDIAFHYFPGLAATDTPAQAR
ncbi:MAG: hypothetical protein CRU78_06225 [Candidatus Accumulibacter phosphatis]|uniref:Uncharacterized protein n=1 Tax=Candidatus Accumulibacter phosphatis TaxID=327160 RepID=A0A6A7RRT0_9PROT|nr:hypothetical protein [Candidatus Accumulibacter phosphatis]